MRICFLADGQSIHTKRWCDHFAARGHEVHLITFRNSSIQSTRVHFVDSGSIAVKGGNWRVLLKIREVKRTIKKIKPDVVHAHYATSYGIVGALSGFHPFVVTALGTDVLISPVQSFIYRKLLSYVFKKADWITAMADHMKSTMVSLGFPEEKISVVPFGVDQNIFFPLENKVMKEEFIICSTRNLEPVYNIDLLLKAVSLVKDKIAPFRLELIGDGSLREELQNRSKDLGISEFVFFHGRVEQEKIAQQLRDSHVFVTTSLSDGNNISLNEAMACGVIPVATAIPANVQWITDRVNGFLVGVDEVEKLSSVLVEIRNNFTHWHEKIFETNLKIVSEKASWQNNMAIVEEKYFKLINQ